MSLKGNATEIKETFLTQIANEYGFFKTSRDVFIARFAETSASTPNKEVANNLKMKEYELSRYLYTICSAFGFASSERGRKPKGQSPWEKAYKWLWNEKYNDFIKQEPSIDNKEAEVNIVIDWRLVCSKMLEKQRETQRLRRKATEMGFELNTYVPLGLVERKQQQRRTGNIEAKQLNQLEPEVIVKIYKDDEFLQRFTEQNQGSGNKHTAIIGEAGVGKTTLLGKIASNREKNTDNLFIFISLSNLEGQNLHNYLLKQWFSEAMGESYPELDVTPEIENKFIKRFRQGGVWLLLDGVDEMRNTTPLYLIESQLKDWLNQVRVVLTCRNNVWDASVNNGIAGFDTFKAQNFESGQVNEFIEKWFEEADNKQQGDLLKAKLQEPGREKIRDLVRNPLCLSLLCQTFYVNKADLPETKAALYQRFILYLQEWKQHLYFIDRETQEELHKALGKLALAGINSETKFRFRDSVARQEMGDSVFELARDVIWLHQVDRDTQTDEAVFAFFHPNFQEYFAALAIDDWSYFLNHVPHDPKQGTYRIFEQQWKEVILLWLGRDDVEKYHKDKFINELANFNDGCENSHYRFQALFLAAALISEFKIDDKQADEIVKRITKLSFGTFNAQDNNYFKYIYSVESGARSALLQTDRTKALKALEEILPKLKGYSVSVDTTVRSFIEKLSPQSANIAKETNIENLIDFLYPIQINNSKEYQRLLAIQKLKAKDPSNKKVIKALIYLVQKTQESDIFSEATKALEEIALVNSQAQLSLVQLLEDTNKGYIRLEAAKILVKTAAEHKHEITTTILDLFMNFDSKFISPSWIEYNEYTKSDYYSEFEDLLEETAVDNLQAIETLIKLLFQEQDYHRKITSILKKIAFGNKEAIIKLEQLCQSKQDDTTSWLAANSLLEINPLNSYAIDTLTYIVESSQNKSIRWRASEKLWEIGRGNSKVFKTLIEKVCEGKDTWRILRTKHDNNPDIIKSMIDIMLDSNCNKDVRNLTIRELEEIAIYNSLVRDAFIRLMKTETDEDICRQAADIWLKINPGSQEAEDIAVDVLTSLLKSPNQDDYSRLQTAKSLDEIRQGNLDSINTIIYLMLNSNKWGEQDSEDFPSDDYVPSVVGIAATYLRKIYNTEILRIILKHLKQWVTHPDNAKDTRRRILCLEIIFQYAKNMSYPEFYQAWHDKPCFIPSLENQFIDIASQLNSTSSTYTLYIDAEKIALKTDENVISKLICTKIFKILSLPVKEIPKIADVADLQLKLIKLTEYLQKKNLFLLFDKCKPTEVLLNICYTLVDPKEIHIAWITDEPLEAPLRGFPPNQPNLLNAIQSWINEIE